MKIEVLKIYRTEFLTIKLLRVNNTYKVIEEADDNIVIDEEYQLFSIALSKFKNLVLYFL